MSSSYHPMPVVIEKDGSNEKAYDLYSRLLKDRIIFLGTPINDPVANAIIAQLLFLESDDPTKEIFMYINSPGGDVTAGLAIYDAMRYVRPAINTVCMGHAASMACTLLSSGAKGKRFSLPHSRIMVHQVQGGVRGSAPDIAIQFEEMTQLNNILLEILAQNTGRSVAEMKLLSERDKWMSPAEAKDLGIIDEIHTVSTRISND